MTDRITEPVFVDTNILVYARDLSDREKHEIARQHMEWLWDHKNGHISVQVLNEYFVTVTQKLTPGMPSQDAWSDLESLALWNPVPIQWDLLQSAREFCSRHSISWWDALIIAAANASRSTILLSEDLNHGQTYGMTTVLNPFRLD